MELSTVASVALPPFLKTYWVLAAGSVLVTLLPLPLVSQSFRDAVMLSACRGKLWHQKPVALGPLSELSVPQAWFLHFYLVGGVCNFLTLLAYASSSCQTLGKDPHVQATSFAALLLFQCHLVRRALETKFVMKYPKNAKMHIIAYIFGLSYYAVVPLSLVPDHWYWQHGWQHLGACESALQQALQGLCQSLAARHVSFLLGIMVFAGGNVLQFAAHRALALLSSKGSSKAANLASRTADARGYKLPTGRLFEQVSCPHYAAEIMVYVGLALVTGGRLTVLLMLVWVVVNLVLASKATHAWYKQHFKGAYPTKRRALIPAVFLLQ